MNTKSMRDEIDRERERENEELIINEYIFYREASTVLWWFLMVESISSWICEYNYALDLCKYSNWQVPRSL